MKFFLLTSLFLSTSLHAAGIHLTSTKHVKLMGANATYSSGKLNPFCYKNGDVEKYQQATEDLNIIIAPELDQKCDPVLKSGRLEFKSEKTGYYIKFKNSKKAADRLTIYCKSSGPSHFLTECSETLPKKDEDLKVDITKDTILEIVIME